MRNGQGSVSGELLKWEDGKKYLSKARTSVSPRLWKAFSRVSSLVPIPEISHRPVSQQLRKICYLKLSFSNWNDNST
tara:strand:+ start:96 stop:326 length:231 start_codon:yes stop_codon:yes gene_type:complete